MATVTVRAAGGGAWVTGGGDLPIDGMPAHGARSPGHEQVMVKALTEFGVRVDGERTRPIASTALSVKLGHLTFGGQEEVPSTRLQVGVRLLAGLDLEWTTDQPDSGPLPGGRFAMPLTLEFATASVADGVNYVGGLPITFDIAPGVALFDGLVAPELTLSARLEPYGGLYVRGGRYDDVAYYDFGFQGSTQTTLFVWTGVLLALVVVGVAEGVVE